MSKLEKEIQTITSIISQKYKPEKIILFGSAANGQVKENSDIDFFIIKDSSKPRHYRSAELYRLIRNVDRRHPIDFVVYTPKEVKKRTSLGDFFVTNILQEGRIIYENKQSQKIDDSCL